MGGRGSAFGAGTKTTNQEPKKEDPNFKINLKVDDDPESEIHNLLFNELKALNVSIRKSTDDTNTKKSNNLLVQETQLLNLANEYKNLVSTTANKDNNLKFSFKEFPISINGMTRIGLHNKQSKVLLQNIVLNKNMIHNNNFNEKKESIKTGWSASVDSNNVEKSTLTHEFGHLLSYNIAVQRYQKGGREISSLFNPKSKSAILSHMKKDVIKIAVEKYGVDPNKRDEIYVSQYSATKVAEWFAETFTNLKLSSNPKPIAKALGDFINKYN